MEELKTKVEMLEQRLTQASQDSSERADQLGHTERKFSEQIQTLRQKLSTVEAQKQQEREELGNQLKKLSATLSHTQQELQSREQVDMSSLPALLIGPRKPDVIYSETSENGPSK